METRVYQALLAFLKSQSGLALADDKSYLLNSRLQPVAEAHGMRTMAELAAKLSAGPSDRLKQDVVEAMTTNETSFFRDGNPFETFRTFVLPELVVRRKASRRIRILCAAASSGQEPYSLAMILAEAKATFTGWNVEIIGIDLDQKILSRAEAGVYSQFEVQRGLPVTMLMRHFEQAPENTWRLKAELRGMVKFRQRNLLHSLADLGQFDVIFCRNVLIYFDLPTKKDVLQRLSAQMAQDGFLFLGGAETVLDITDRLMPSPSHRGLYLPRHSARPTRAAAG